MLGWQDSRPLSVAISNDRAKRLADKPGIKTIADAVLNFPVTYARLGSPQGLDELRVGEKSVSYTHLTLPTSDLV